MNNIQIRGRIQFFNDNKNKIEIPARSDLGLTKSDKPVPYWAHQYIFSTEELKSASTEQKDFYAYFKKCFLNDEFIDICGNENYSFILYYDLLSDFYDHSDFEKLQEQFSKIKKYYSKAGKYISGPIIKEHEKRGDYEKAWNLIYKHDFISVKTIWEYQQKLKTPLLDGELIAKLGGFDHLTEFGQRNIEKIKPFAIEYLKIFENNHCAPFFELFFDKNRLYKAVNNNEYIPDYYSKYYLSEAEYQHYKSIDESQISIYDPNKIRHVVEKAVLNQCRLILKKSEDLYRASIGMPKVGEGWISETELYYKIANAFSEFEVVHHGTPAWLGLQHLDIYFPKQNIGVEYQGTQHYEAVDYFGGQEAFEKTKERDEKKRKKCIDNNCILIYVEEVYDFEIVINEIKKGIQTVNNSTLPKKGKKENKQ